MPNRKELQSKGFQKGASRIIRDNKRNEAELRNEETPVERTRAFREGRVKVEEA
jgi:hypothetical protein